MRRGVWLWLAGGLVAAVGLGEGVRRFGFTPEQKAFYANERTLNFVRPGLELRVLGAEIGADGTMVATVRITDPLGVPLDREGRLTPGAVGLSFVAATIPADNKHYTAYTTRVQRSPLTGVSATQAASDSGGTFAKLADGEYRYTFRTKAPAGFDRTATHTIGVYGSRNLNEFELGVGYASTVFHFVPAGGAVTKVRDVIRTESCNGCHTEIAAHGGARRGMAMCVLCHTPQTVDPDTGNTVDMTVMTHKIHMGRELPSVQAGGKYSLIGNGQRETDYSHVGFPANNRNCAACHVQEGPNAGAQARAMYQPSQAGCGSCHDDIDFAAGKGHPVQLDDTRCAQCHRPAGEREWDLSIEGAHTRPEKSRNLKGIAIEILEIRDTNAGQQPAVSYRLRDGEGKLLTPGELNSLSFVLAGPTADYAAYWSESGRTDPPSPGGAATHRFARAIPAGATGSYSIAVEGYRNVTFEGPGRETVTVRDTLQNVTKYFSVEGKAAEPRRTIVSLAKCNACHADLEAHGRNRNQIEHCVDCHNPNLTDAARRTPAQMPAESVNFSTMIHRLHTGATQGRPYVIYGFGGAANDYSKVALPADARNCAMCHVNNTERLPLAPNLLNVVDPRGWLPNPGPAGAACLSCHSSKDAAAHVQLTTSSLGESCNVCHGPNAAFSVAKSHAR
ncbi:MAG: OmcA/MtrC family decaheme c-type cytochrome [Acidobacteriaceae bacterium]|nr:OmcA/MtrC family decaheme c-type cytochrome [Acidobacteriaceae bacterium]